MYHRFPVGLAISTITECKTDTATATSLE